jgi:hypothetical protein
LAHFGGRAGCKPRAAGTAAINAACGARPFRSVLASSRGRMVPLGGLRLAVGRAAVDRTVDPTTGIAAIGQPADPTPPGALYMERRDPKRKAASWRFPRRRTCCGTLPQAKRAVAVCDEKPGIRAFATTAPDLRPDRLSTPPCSPPEFVLRTPVPLAVGPYACSPIHSLAQV